MTPIDVILEAGAIATGTTVDEIRQGGRSTRRAMARRMFVASKMRVEGYSYPEIGRALGRHHTTVMNLLGRARGPKKARRT